ncbi:MAG TPA: hypothetical protein VGM05_25115 [Planctomycetaceae bacterium]
MALILNFPLLSVQVRSAPSSANATPGADAKSDTAKTINKTDAAGTGQRLLSALILLILEVRDAEIVKIET